MMKHTWIRLWLLGSLFCMSGMAFSAPLTLSELPPAVQQTVKQELGDYRVRNIQMRTIEGKDVYTLETRGRQDRRMR